MESIWIRLSEDLNGPLSCVFSYKFGTVFCSSDLEYWLGNVIVSMLLPVSKCGGAGSMVQCIAFWM